MTVANYSYVLVNLVNFERRFDLYDQINLCSDVLKGYGCDINDQ